MSWKDRAVAAPEETPQASSGSWRDRAEPVEQDILENAGKDIAGIGKGLWEVGKKGAKMLTTEAYDTGRQLGEGKDFMETPLGEDVSGGVRIAKALPGAVVDRVKELATDPVGSFKEHPVNTALDVASVALPLLKGASAAKLAGMTRLAEAAEGSGKVGKFIRGAAEGLGEFTKEQTAKAAGFGPAAFTADEIEKTKAIGDFLRRKKVVTPLNSSKDMMNRLGEVEKTAIREMNEPIQRFDAAGIGASTGKQVAEQITSELFDRYFTDLPPEVIRKLKLGISTGTNYDKIAEKIRLAAADAAVFGDEPMSFASQVKLKRDLQAVGNFDSEARALRIPKAASGIARADLETNVKAAADLMGDPSLAAGYTNANRDFGMVQDAKAAVSKQIGKEVGGDALPLTDVATAGAGAVMTGANPVGGAGAYLVKRGYKAFGNQLAAEGADRLRSILQSNPAALGEYATPLLKAAERGSQSLATTDFVLQQRDPKYRQMLEALDSGARTSAAH